MKLDTDGYTIVFSNGRRITHVNFGIIGLGPNMQVGGGCDTMIDRPEWGELNKQEKIELADYMIEGWQAYKSAAE